MYSIKALPYGYIGFDLPGPVMYYQEKLDQKVRVVGYFWLLRGNGRVICVDTGLGRPVNRQQTIGNFTVDPGMDTVSLLRREGLTPEDVDTLILTHLHYDHSANVRLFSRAEILISRRGWNKTLAPDHPAIVPAHLYPPDVLRYLQEEAEPRVRLLGEEAQILPGLKVFWVGGHTPCSQAIMLTTAKGRAIITGDTVFCYGNIEENIPVACCTDLAECYLAMDRIRGEGDLIVPGHDPLVMERHPGGVIA